MTEQQDKARESLCSQHYNAYVQTADEPIAYHQYAEIFLSALNTTARPSVEALNRRAKACLSACDGVEIEWLESGLPGCVQGLREDRDTWMQRARLSEGEAEQLRTTNAAQAERIAELEGRLTKALGLLNAETQIEAEANLLSLLQSSIPPEPQATVELTDEEIIKRYFSDDSLRTKILDHARNIAIERALNQRQAVKTEPEIIGYEHDRALMEAHQNTLSDDYFTARPQIDTGDRRRVFEAGFSRGWNAPKPLSAAQGVPEGMEQVILKGGNYGWRYTVEQAAKLLRAIDRNGGLMIGGEQYPNSACCCDSAYSLELMLKSATPEQAESKEGKNG